MGKGFLGLGSGSGAGKDKEAKQDFKKKKPVEEVPSDDDFQYDDFEDEGNEGDEEDEGEPREVIKAEIKEARHLDVLSKPSQEPKVPKPSRSVEEPDQLALLIDRFHQGYGRAYPNEVLANNPDYVFKGEMLRLLLAILDEQRRQHLQLLKILRSR